MLHAREVVVLLRSRRTILRNIRHFLNIAPLEADTLVKSIVEPFLKDYSSSQSRCFLQIKMLGL